MRDFIIAAVGFAGGIAFAIGSIFLTVACAIRTHNLRHDPQQGSAQGEGDGAGEIGFVQHHAQPNTASTEQRS
jgi:hypothetical protein